MSPSQVVMIDVERSHEQQQPVVDLADSLALRSG